MVHKVVILGHNHCDFTSPDYIRGKQPFIYSDQSGYEPVLNSSWKINYEQLVGILFCLFTLQLVLLSEVNVTLLEQQPYNNNENQNWKGLWKNILTKKMLFVSTTAWKEDHQNFAEYSKHEWT